MTQWQGRTTQQSPTAVAMAVSPLRLCMRGKESEIGRVGEWERTSATRCPFLPALAMRVGLSPAYGQHMVGGCCTWSATRPIWNGHQTLINRLTARFQPSLSANPFIHCRRFTNKSCRATCKLQLCLYGFDLVQSRFPTTSYQSKVHGNWKSVYDFEIF
jgi:hypothetical protein